MKFAAFFVCFALLCGFGSCSTRETAKSQLQADQAIEASHRIATGDDMQAIYELPELTEEQRALLKGCVEKIATLLVSARESLAPGLLVLSKGEPVEVSTTTEQAIADTTAFTKAAMLQTARAQVEAEAFVSTWRAGSMAWNWGMVAAQSMLGQALGGTGGLAAMIAAALKLMQMHKRGTAAQVAMAEYATDLENAETDADVERLKAEHKAKQKAAKIHDVVAARVAAAKELRKPILAPMQGEEA